MRRRLVSRFVASGSVLNCERLAEACDGATRPSRMELASIPADDDVLTTGQIAKICGVSPGTVAKWVDAGRLKGWKIPGSGDRRIVCADLKAFLVVHGMPTIEQLVGA